MIYNIMMSNYFKVAFLSFWLFFTSGIVIGFTIGHNNFYFKFSCHNIANFHQDYLMNNYGVDFVTDFDNPLRRVNEKASQLNSQLLQICLKNPTE